MTRSRRSNAAAAALALCALILTSACQRGEEYPLVLRGGRVMDPATGLDSIRDVAIRDGKIVAVSEQTLRGTDVVDVSGKVVAPGFIDLHAHGQTTGDMQLQAQDGVTTALEMEQGVYPVAPWYAFMEGTAPINYGVTVSHISARFAVFHGIEIGHWPINTEPAKALGAMPAGSNRAATPKQVDSVAALLRQGLSEGALGIGFGINYSPGATPAEIAALFRVAKEVGVAAFVHTRAFGIGAIREAINTARETGAALHIVHIGSSSGDDIVEALAAIDSGRAAGMDLTTEVYPYTAASTRLETAMFKIDYGDLAWAATGERLTRESFDRYRKQGGWIILYLMKDANVERAIAHPAVMVASDGVPFVDGKGHPRGAGTFARLLGHYSREKQLLSLMDALAKVTIMPARRLEGYVPAMAGKGRIGVGMDADITVFHPDSILDRATFTEPTNPSAGISQVLVNGTFVVRDGQLVPDARPGRPIRTR
jgi:N-acyl-D-aspartate/D-glutamate deacylase